MQDNQDDAPIKRVPLDSLKMEEGAEELLDTPEMEPYIRLAMAVMQDKGVDVALKEIADLPLEKRYVWRVASALKWAFMDFDTENVVADLQTLKDDDRKALIDLLKYRPMQFCFFLAAVFGERQMELLIANAIRTARQVHGVSESET